MHQTDSSIVLIVTEKHLPLYSGNWHRPTGHNLYPYFFITTVNMTYDNYGQKTAAPVLGNVPTFHGLPAPA